MKRFLKVGSRSAIVSTSAFMYLTMAGGVNGGAALIWAARQALGDRRGRDVDDNGEELGNLAKAFRPPAGDWEFENRN